MKIKMLSTIALGAILLAACSNGGFTSKETSFLESSIESKFSGVDVRVTTDDSEYANLGDNGLVIHVDPSTLGEYDQSDILDYANGIIENTFATSASYVLVNIDS